MQTALKPRDTVSAFNGDSVFRPRRATAGGAEQHRREAETEDDLRDTFLHAVPLVI